MFAADQGQPPLHGSALVIITYDINVCPCHTVNILIVSTLYLIQLYDIKLNRYRIKLSLLSKRELNPVVLIRKHRHECSAQRVSSMICILCMYYNISIFVPLQVF